MELLKGYKLKFTYYHFKRYDKKREYKILILGNKISVRFYFSNVM